MKLDTHSLTIGLLQARCALERINPISLVAFGVLLTGLALALVWVPYLNNDLIQLHDAVQKLDALSKSKKAVATLGPSIDELRMHHFYETLGDNGYAEQQLKTFFDIAIKNGLKLNQADYKTSINKNNDTVEYQIQLPVKGPYSAIRQFCEEVLLIIPFASLDEMNFKREAINNNNIEAKLRFTLYLSGSVSVKPLVVHQ